MKAVVFTGNGQYEITERQIPTINHPNEIIVKVLAAKICGTDMHILADPPEYDATENFILGHEFVGEVVEVGNECSIFKPSDRLICDNNISCGVCAECQSRPLVYALSMIWVTQLRILFLKLFMLATQRHKAMR
ncbi:MAG TPA: alcohol dehydrogenase catalytic domain-containing protein [Clostridiaceae bacterium]|nr:alcohol dehydrogenase catalytic domain-containing protein [Clostridiaceae bacterium]